jgi:hypothetical protein
MPAVPYQLNSRQVLFRIAFRLVLLAVFATVGRQGFANALAMLLAMSTIFCGITAAMRSEATFGRVLSHWDEAAIYALLGYLVSALA